MVMEAMVTMIENAFLYSFSLPLNYIAKAAYIFHKRYVSFPFYYAKGGINLLV